MLYGAKVERSGTLAAGSDGVLHTGETLCA